MLQVVQLKERRLQQPDEPEEVFFFGLIKKKPTLHYAHRIQTPHAHAHEVFVCDVRSEVWVFF